MEIDPDADLDTSQVEDLRDSSGDGGGGFGGGRMALGGGGLGLVILVIYLLLSHGGGGSTGGSQSGLGGLNGLPEIGGGPSSVQQGEAAERLKQKCATGQSATALDCEAVAFINSIQNYWTTQLARSGTPYRPVSTIFFTNSVSTGCGEASSDTGPFYCPADKKVYIDLSFYKELETRFGTQGGLFPRAYVLAHEYGHHVQDLLGTEQRVRTRSGPNSDSVKLELQADCYAGVWANHATQTRTASGKPLIENITAEDKKAGLDTASRIGDDFIQTHLGSGRVNKNQFTHGSSAQREKWLTVGLTTGNPAQCDTFSPGVNLG